MSYEKNETKLKILKAAQDLFEKTGYNKTTVEDIAKEAGGLTKGAIYYYFESKRDVLDNILTYDSTWNVKKMVDGNTILERVRNYILDSLEMGNLFPVVEEPQIAKKNPEIIGEYYLFLNDLKHGLSKQLTEGMKDKTLQTEYPEEITGFLLVYSGMCVGLNIKDMSKEKYLKNIRFVKNICDKLKFPIINDEILKKAERLYNEMNYNKDN